MKCSLVFNKHKISRDPSARLRSFSRMCCLFIHTTLCRSHHRLGRQAVWFLKHHQALTCYCQFGTFIVSSFYHLNSSLSLLSFFIVISRDGVFWKAETTSFKITGTFTISGLQSEVTERLVKKKSRYLDLHIDISKYLLSCSLCCGLTSTLFPLCPTREGISSEASGTGGGNRHRPGSAGDGEGSARHPKPVQTFPEEKEVE